MVRGDWCRRDEAVKASRSPASPGARVQDPALRKRQSRQAPQGARRSADSH